MPHTFVSIAGRTSLSCQNWSYQTRPDVPANRAFLHDWSCPSLITRRFEIRRGRRVSSRRKASATGEVPLKIFVGFGYNDRDQWIPDLVFPLIKAFGSEVVTGEEMQGQELDDGVRQRIETSDAMIALLTRRGEPSAEGVYETHRWVVEELALAIAGGLRVVEVREEGVSDQGGIAGNRQRIRYSEAERDKLLVELATTVGNWVRTVDVTLRLLPPEVVEEFRPLLGAPGFRCTYTVLEGNRESAPKDTLVRPIKGGLFVYAAGLSPQSLVRITIEGNGRRWTSDYEAPDSIITLKPN